MPLSESSFKIDFSAGLMSFGSLPNINKSFSCATCLLCTASNLFTLFLLAREANLLADKTAAACILRCVRCCIIILIAASASTAVRGVSVRPLAQSFNTGNLSSICPTIKLSLPSMFLSCSIKLPVSKVLVNSASCFKICWFFNAWRLATYPWTPPKSPANPKFIAVDISK